MRSASPGGRAEPGESALATALRESSEEIDLDPESVEPLGELDHLTTVTRRAYIVPVVGLLPSRPALRLNEGEVDEALHVPMSELLEPGVFREERWGTPDTARPVYFFELVGDTIWGATAAILRQLLARLTDTDPGTDVDMDPARDLGTDAAVAHPGAGAWGGLMPGDRPTEGSPAPAGDATPAETEARPTSATDRRSSRSWPTTGGGWRTCRSARASSRAGCGPGFQRRHRPSPRTSRGSWPTSTS